MNPQPVTDTRTAARIAWSLWAVALALVAGAHVLALASRAPLYNYWVESTFVSPTFASLGALIVSRRPGNVIGWIFLVPGVGGAMQCFSGQYATAALAPNGPALPGGAYAAWFSTLAQTATVYSILFLLLLFPTGRPPSPRWRAVVWFTGLIFVASIIFPAITPGPLLDFAPVRNPFGVEAAAGLLDLFVAIEGWVVLACVVAVVVSLILRFYRSRGEERLQLKWFVYAATLGVLAILFGVALAPVAFGGWFGILVWTLAGLSLPVSAGIAILRYRLYDIDAIVNRTLVYGPLTISLVAVYAASVVVLQRTFVFLTGEGSQLVIVASTLAIAALFNPLRRRVQAFVDRRFYRQKYDARRTLEAFSIRLRDETDLDDLTGELVGVVRRTVQPAHASLWLREAGVDGEPATDDR